MNTASKRYDGEIRDGINDRLWDWRAAVLTLFLLQISSLRLVVTEWVPFLYFTQTMIFLGGVLGLALGYTKFSSWGVFLLAAAYTFLLPTAQLLGAIEKTGWLWHDLLSLSERLLVALNLFINKKPVYDPLFFASIMTFTFWMIGVYSGYKLSRGMDFLGVVILPATALLVIQAFDAPNSQHIWELALFIFTSLLLMGRISFLNDRVRWKTTRFLLSDETRNVLEHRALMIALSVVFIAWLLPGGVKAIKPAAKAWQEFSQPILNEFSGAVRALKSHKNSSSRTAGGFYGDSLFLGNESFTGDETIFTVGLKKNTYIPIRNYWKGRSYDFYTNGVWVNSEEFSAPFNPASDSLVIENSTGGVMVELTFTTHAIKQDLLYAPAEMLWVNKIANLQYLSSSLNIKDVSAWFMQEPLLDGDQYKVRAMISDPTVEELRTANTNYPDWVKKYYLQLPKEISLQLQGLAGDISASGLTAYDKAELINLYLRREIQYQQALEETPPENRDPVLWVLLDYKKGFCTYYASAEVLLLRAIGIPARIAVGFVEGEYDEIKRQYNVKYRDAHAWAEVYFPGIGWVVFEPTSSQYPLQRPETRDRPREYVSEFHSANDDKLNYTPAPTSEADQSQPTYESVEVGASALEPSFLRIIIFLLIPLFLYLIFVVVRHLSLNNRIPMVLAAQYESHEMPNPAWLQYWIWWTTLSPIERLFQNVNLSLFILGQKQPTYVTSQGCAEVLSALLPAARGTILSLLEQYHSSVYSPRMGDIFAARQMAQSLLIMAVKSRIKKIFGFSPKERI